MSKLVREWESDDGLRRFPTPRECDEYNANVAFTNWLCASDNPDNANPGVTPETATAVVDRIRSDPQGFMLNAKLLFPKMVRGGKGRKKGKKANEPTTPASANNPLDTSRAAE